MTPEARRPVTPTSHPGDCFTSLARGDSDPLPGQPPRPTPGGSVLPPPYRRTMTQLSHPEEDQLLAGEPVRALVKAFVQCIPTQIDNGAYHVEGDLDASTGAPLARALMRVEAEMLLRDADIVGSSSYTPIRKPAQRRADAFVEVARRVQRAITR